LNICFKFSNPLARAKASRFHVGGKSIDCGVTVQALDVGINPSLLRPPRRVCGIPAVQAIYMPGRGGSNHHASIFNAARNADCGISTFPNCRIRFLPSFCFSSSFRLREISPP